ncbi:MAG: HAD family hydrolase [Lachnospiraceae bacterium]
MKIKAVVFDLDDTLILERDYVHSGFLAVASKFLEYYPQENITPKQLKDTMLSFWMEDSKTVFNKLFDFFQKEYKKEDILYFVEVYRNHIPTSCFFEDVLPTLQFLKDHNIKTGIITDGFKHAQRKKLNALHAEELFDEILVTDELGREYWKPSPTPFEIMKQKLQCEFEEMIYIGDNPSKDFHISSIFPIRCIRINREYGVYLEGEYLNGIKEWKTIQSLYEIQTLIKS